MQYKKILSNFSEVYLFLFATIHLLYFGFDGYAKIFNAKILTFSVINGLYFAGILITFLVKYLSFDSFDLKPKFKELLQPSRLFALIYLAFTILSSFGSFYFPLTLNGVSRFEGLLTISVYVFSFIAISFFYCKKKYLLYAFAISVTLFGILSAIQLMGFNPLSLYPDGTSFYGAGIDYPTAFIGTIGNTNLSGAFICLALPFLAVIMLRAETRVRWWLSIPVILLTVTALKMDVTSTLLGLAAGITVAVPLLLKFNKKKTAIYFAVLILLSILLVVMLYQFDFGGFFGEVHSILHGEISDKFGSGRIRIWKNVLSEIPEHLFFGKGPDTMKKADFPAFERYYPSLDRVITRSIDVAHNEPLNILYHQGIFALIFYIGFIISTLTVWFKNRGDYVILALGIGFISYLVQSLFTFSMCLTAPYFWICAGLIIGYSNENTKKTTLG